MRCSAAPGRRSLSLSPYPSTLECHHAARPHRCSQGKSADYLQRVGETIYQALRAVGVPENDRFQIFQEHAPGTLIYDPGYLGVDRTDDFICIQITWNEGRTLEQKKALYAGIADGLHAAVGIRREDVFINLVEVKKENWSFGNGQAQYVS